MKPVKTGALLSCLIISCSVAVAAEEVPRFTLSAGAEYTTGTYGGDTDIEDLYVPFKATLDFRRVSFRLTVPHLSVRAPEGTVITGPGGEPVPGTGDIVTNSGIGDVIGSVTVYDVVRNRRLGFAMDLTGKVKFGTADADKGLGTGENDFTVQADFLKFADRITWIASIGYKFRGQPPDAVLDDAFLASAGGAYITGETLHVNRCRPGAGVQRLPVQPAGSRLAPPIVPLEGIHRQQRGLGCRP